MRNAVERSGTSIVMRNGVLSVRCNAQEGPSGDIVMRLNGIAQV